MLDGDNDTQGPQMLVARTREWRFVALPDHNAQELAFECVRACTHAETGRKRQDMGAYATYCKGFARNARCGSAEHSASYRLEVYGSLLIRHSRPLLRSNGTTASAMALMSARP